MQDLRDDVRSGHEVRGVHPKREQGLPCLPGKHVAKQRFALGDVVQERGGLRREQRQDKLHKLSQGLCRDGVVPGLLRFGMRKLRAYVPGRDGQCRVQALHDDVRRGHEVRWVHCLRKPRVPWLPCGEVAKRRFSRRYVVQVGCRVRRE